MIPAAARVTLAAMTGLPATRARLIVLALALGFAGAGGGCTTNSRGLGFAHAAAAGSRGSRGMMYNDIGVEPGAGAGLIAILLPDGDLVTLDQLTVQRITALNDAPGKRGGAVWAMRSSRVDWLVTWPDYGSLPARMFSMTNGLRGYELRFDQGKLVSLSARVDKNDEAAARSRWAPSLARIEPGSKAEDARIYRLPLTEAQLIDLLGPIRSRTDHPWY